MDTITGTVIWVGQEKGIKPLPPKENTMSGTPKTCYECMYSSVVDTNYDDILLCKQHNTYVSIEEPICCKFIKESWVD